MASPDFEPEQVLPFGPSSDDEEESLGGFLNRMERELSAQEDRPVEDETVETEEENFPPEVAQDVIGLMHLGHLTGRFEVMGHVFVLRTLKLGEELAVGQVVDEFAGTVVQGQAFAAALVAASLMTVDGRPVLAPLGPDQEATIRDKFEYITQRWYTDTVLEIYEAYKTLQVRQRRAYEAIQGKSKAGRTTSTP
jgi:hypothetical protein